MTNCRRRHYGSQRVGRGLCEEETLSRKGSGEEDMVKEGRGLNL